MGRLGLSFKILFQYYSKLGKVTAIEGVSFLFACESQSQVNYFGKKYII